MGGMHGFGPVAVPGSDQPYHHDWEPRILAMTVLTAFERLRVNNGRADREEMPPAEYLEAGYFDRWVYSTERGLLENGVLVPGEVEAMIERLRAGEEMPRTSDPAQVKRVLDALADVPRLPEAVNPRFAVGDRVRVSRMRPPGHNRSPRYLRGVAGTVERLQCNDVRPGAGAEPVYAVAFDAADIWGEDADRGSVVADLWEGYLEPAD
ncbi:MAG: nitrile hydratase subunit beta [Gaiellaceae bacterium]|nr:nitrile hydratase subunit beta [Gaiellaceae bacterium]